MDAPIASSTVWERCSAELAELQACGIALCAAMRRASQTLQESGRPPSAMLIEEMSQFRLRFERVQAQVIPTGTIEPDGDTSPISIQRLNDEVRSRAIVRKALRRLECLTNIRHVEQPNFPPWQRCLAEANRLRETLLSATAMKTCSAAEHFCAPESPLNGAVSLVIDGDELNDKRWQELVDSVAATYGRELTTAIARGKLALVSTPRTDHLDLHLGKNAR